MISEREILEFAPLPPDQMQEKVQRMFVEEFKSQRAKEPSRKNFPVICEILRNPIWAKWGKIGSYMTARKVLDRYYPGWNKEGES